MVIIYRRIPRLGMMTRGSEVNTNKNFLIIAYLSLVAGCIGSEHEDNLMVLV